MAAPTVADVLADPVASAILEAFRPFLESAQVPKIWHNYGFDRHVLSNMGVRLAGFAGDTMHMARWVGIGQQPDCGELCGCGGIMLCCSTAVVVHAAQAVQPHLCTRLLPHAMPCWHLPASGRRWCGNLTCAACTRQAGHGQRAQGRQELLAGEPLFGP